MNDLKWPDGVERRHVHEAHGHWLHKWPFGLLGLALVLLAALVGVLGAYETVTATGDGIELSIKGPVRIRSGEYLEMLFTVETERDIRDAVLSIDEQVWNDVTINTMIPQPTEESFGDGAFEFHFGALPLGTTLLVKVDGQINPTYPPGNNEGAISLVDSGAILATIDYSMRVLP